MARPKLRPIHRYQPPGIHAIKLVCTRAPGGGMISLPLGKGMTQMPLGKGMAQMLLGMGAEVPECLLPERPARISISPTANWRAAMPSRPRGA